MRLELPYPPSVGNYWGHRVVPRKGGKPFVHMYLTKRATEFRDAVQAVVIDMASQATANNSRRFEAPHFGDSRLAVRISVHPPNRRKFDLDNLCKSTLDALTHAGVWNDDEQIDDLQLRRGEIVPDGAVIVEVSELFPAASEGGGT